MSHDDTRFAERAEAVAAVGRELAERGWAPATSGNFSARVDGAHAAITISGRDKRLLTAADIMLVDLDGAAVGSHAQPSAETLLHTQLYRRDGGVGAVLHTHSRTQTVASRVLPRDGAIRLAGYELLKAFDGIATHATALDVPVFANTQDMTELAREVDAALTAEPRLRVYLIEGHGAYAWGRDLAGARRHLEALDFLLACELDHRSTP